MLFRSLLGAARLDPLRERYAELAAAREAVAAFDRCLRSHFAAYEAPSLSKLDELLAYAQAPLRAEMVRRGEPLQRPLAALAAVEAVPFADMPAFDTEQEDDTDYEDDPRHPVQVDRESAYSTLGDIADFLAAIEPHSPVPYLLRRAIVWGSMNTAELYQELFVQSKGQINVFELLGLVPGDSGAA